MKLTSTLLLLLSSFAPTSSFADTEAPLPPSYIFRENFPGTTLYSYDAYQSGSPNVSVQVTKKSDTDEFIKATGSFEISEQAARVFFEQMTRPLAYSSGRGQDPHTPGLIYESKKGGTYNCIKTTIPPQPSRYFCNFNISHIETGTF